MYPISAARARRISATRASIFFQPPAAASTYVLGDHFGETLARKYGSLFGLTRILSSFSVSTGRRSNCSRNSGSLATLSSAAASAIVSNFLDALFFRRHYRRKRR